MTIGEDDTVAHSSGKEEPAAEMVPNETGEAGGEHRDPSVRAVTNEIQPPPAGAATTASSARVVALALYQPESVKESFTLACSGGVVDVSKQPTKDDVAAKEGPPASCSCAAMVPAAAKEGVSTVPLSLESTEKEPLVLRSVKKEGPSSSSYSATAADGTKNVAVDAENGGANCASNQINSSGSNILIIVSSGKTKKKTAKRPSFNLFLKQAADRAAWLSTHHDTPKSSNNTATTTRHGNRSTRRNNNNNTTSRKNSSSPALPMALSGKKSRAGGKRKERDPAASFGTAISAKRRNRRHGDDINNESSSATSASSFHHRLQDEVFEAGVAIHHSSLFDSQKEEEQQKPSCAATTALPHGGFNQKKFKHSLQQGNVVQHPRNTDVLLGRGSAIANTPGNVLFRQYVWDRKEEYRATPRMSKFRVATQLVNDIGNLHGGRFLEPHATLTTKSHIVWCEAPLHRAVEKASQALRELKMKEPAPTVGVPLPTPTLLPRPNTTEPLSEPRAQTDEQTTPSPTTTALITATVGGTGNTPLKKRKSKATSPTKNSPSKYPKMPPGPRPVIEKPRKNDVLFGRGGQIALHPGNVQFREFVWQEKDEYERTRNAGIKRDVAMHVIGLVRDLDPPGRFLELAGTSIMDGPWVESTPERILEKTFQALREKRWHWNQKVLSTSAAAEKTSHPMIELEEPLSIGGKEASSLPSTDSASLPDYAEEIMPVAMMAKPVATPQVVPQPTQQYVGEEAFQDKSQEEQMALLQEGSRIAIYWPLDEVFYSATIEDSLQDNFFYVTYDDGQSEWIDLTRNSFYTLKPLAQPRKSVPRPKKKVKPSTKPAPKTAKAKPRFKPKPPTSSAPEPPVTSSLDISIKPAPKAKTVAKTKSEPASKAKVTHASMASTSTKTVSSSSNKTTPTKTSAKAGSKMSVKAASKIPIKAATTLKKAAAKSAKANAKKAPAKSPPCGWAQRNKQIRDGVAKYGTDNWEAVATMVPDWSADACQRRFAIELDPELSRELLTGKEVRQIMRHQSEHGNVWVKLAFKMGGRATSFISEKWGRKIRKVAIEYVEKKTGLKVEKIEDPKTKKVNYHGHFEGAYKAVMATHPF